MQQQQPNQGPGQGQQPPAPTSNRPSAPLPPQAIQQQQHQQGMFYSQQQHQQYFQQQQQQFPNASPYPPMPQQQQVQMQQRPLPPFPSSSTDNEKKPPATAPPSAPAPVPPRPIPFLLASQSKAPLTKPPLEVRVHNLHPPILPQEMLDGLEKHNVEVLCSIGREITQDLMFRAVNLISMLNMNIANAKKVAVIDIETILYYSKILFNKLAEVRLRIDHKLAAERASCSSTATAALSDDDLFKLFSNPPPPTTDPRKAELVAEFERNRAALLEKSIELKKQEWIATLEDPRFARKASESLYEGSGRRK